jgi:surface polysaccharide O-acyltransferase-like enzyme
VEVPRSLAWIDAARVTAIVAVIAIHVASPLVTSRADPPSWWFGNAVDSAARWSVPLFVMISGALLLRSDLADEPVRFYRRRLARILPPLVAWTVIYLIYGYLSADNPQTLREAIAYVAAGRPYFHLYFLYLIGGLYLVTPFLRPLVARSSSRVLGIAVLVFLALGIADSLALRWFGTGGANAATRFVPYIGYFLAGAWLVGQAPTRGRIAASLVTVALGIGLTVVGTSLLIDRFGFGRGLYLYEYLSLTTVPVSLAVFTLFVWSAPTFDRMAARMPGRWLSIVAATTLGIYVIHPLVLTALGNVLGLRARAFFYPVAVPATVLAAFAVSLLIVLILRRVPFVRRIV